MYEKNNVVLYLILRIQRVEYTDWFEWIYFQSEVVKNCCFEAIHTKPVHQFNQREADGTDMQNFVEGSSYIKFPMEHKKKKITEWHV